MPLTEQQQADFDRRLDLAASYFDHDSEACERELLSLLKEPDLPLYDRFTAQVQLVYNSSSWKRGERWRYDAEKTFQALKKEMAGTASGKESVALARFLLQEIKEWQDEDRPSGGEEGKKKVVARRNR